MPQATITAIKYKSSFASQFGGPDGQMHSFIVDFDDGTCGEANSKSQTPPYREGDTMEYTVTKDDPKWGKKLKIGKPGFAPQGGGRTTPAQSNAVKTQGNAGSQPSYQQLSNVAPTSNQWVPQGQTVGMAVKEACEFARASGKGFDIVEIDDIAKKLIWLMRDYEDPKAWDRDSTGNPF